MQEQIILSWSGGKDSAYTLYKLLQNNNYQLITLYTIFSDEYKRVSFHAVKDDLFAKQAQAMGLCLDKIYVTKSETIEEHAAKIENSFLKYKNFGINTVAYGDIFLNDLREYRIKQLKKIDMQPIFPIWKTNTKDNIREFIDLGFKAIVTCVDSNVLDESFVGRIIDNDFIKDLPKNVDPCGENGEFHSFVFEGPIFKEKLDFSIRETVFRDGFYFKNLTLNEIPIDNDFAKFIKDENINKLRTLSPLMQRKTLKLYEKGKSNGIHFDIVSAHRPFEEQKEIYEKYFKTYGEEKICYPGLSDHQSGRAIDIKINNTLSYLPEYTKLGEIWQSMDENHYWGGYDIDEYWHFSIK